MVYLQGTSKVRIKQQWTTPLFIVPVLPLLPRLFAKKGSSLSCLSGSYSCTYRLCLPGFLICICLASVPRSLCLCCDFSDPNAPLPQNNIRWQPFLLSHQNSPLCTGFYINLGDSSARVEFSQLNSISLLQMLIIFISNLFGRYRKWTLVCKTDGTWGEKIHFKKLKQSCLNNSLYLFRYWPVDWTSQWGQWAGCREAGLSHKQN